MIKFIQKSVENSGFFPKIMLVILFVINLCLRLSDMQPGESSSVRSRRRRIFQLIAPHPLYSSDSLSRELSKLACFPLRNHPDFESYCYVCQKACAWCRAVASVTWPASASISFYFFVLSYSAVDML